MNTLRILLVDDHQLFASGLVMVLQSMFEHASIAVTTSGSGALEILDDGRSFHLLIVDLDLPDIGGLDLLAAFRARMIVTPVVVVSATSNESDIQRVLDGGALGFIPKSSNAQTVRAGILNVLDGQVFLPDELWGCVDLVDRKQTAFAHPVRGELATISARQIEVLQLVRQGYSNQHIAAVLGITVATVKSHLSVLFRALSVKSRTACVRVALEKKLID